MIRSGSLLKTSVTIGLGPLTAPIEVRYGASGAFGS